MCIHKACIDYYLAACLMSVYARDIQGRLPQLFAHCTAVFGFTLNLDLTKMCNKLQCIGSCWECLLKDECGEWERRGAGLSVDWVWRVERLSSHDHGINQEVVLNGINIFTFHGMCWLLRRYCTARSGRSPHSYCTLIGTVAVSVASPSVHSCSRNGATYL